MKSKDYKHYTKNELIHHIVLLEQKIDALIRKIYGVKTEKLDPNQLELLMKEDSLGKTEAPFPREEQGAIQKDSLKIRKQTRKPRIPDNLPIEETIIDPPQVKVNPQDYRCIGEEISEQLDYRPGKFTRQRIIRRKYVKRNDKEHAPIIADLPNKLQERCIATPGLLTQIVISKYVDHLPLYRQEQIFKKRYGVEIPRQTMVRWVELVADWIRPIYEIMKNELKSSGYLQVDETPVRYLDRDKGGSSLGYFWVYSHPGCDVVFDWHASRSGDCLDAMIGADYSGVIQCDGYKAYQSYTKKNDAIELAGCWAHARRKFYESKEETPQFSGWILNQLSQLYDIEKNLRNTRAGPALRSALRSSHSRLIVQRIFKALHKKWHRYLPQSRTGKAITYSLKLKPMLEYFLNNGQIEIDNNLVENAIRPTAVGKKNWLFIGESLAGQRSAIIYSIVESCHRRGIEPYSYLFDVLNRLPSMTNKQVYSLTPGNYLRLNKKSA